MWWANWCISNVSQTGVWGQNPSCLRSYGGQRRSDFYHFSVEISHYSAIWIPFRTFLKPFEKPNLQKFENYLKEIKFLAPSKSRLNACTLGLHAHNNFVPNDLVGRERSPFIFPACCATGLRNGNFLSLRVLQNVAEIVAIDLKVLYINQALSYRQVTVIVYVIAFNANTTWCKPILISLFFSVEVNKIFSVK